MSFLPDNGVQKSSNPFNTAMGRAHSSYTASQTNKLVHGIEPRKTPMPLAEQVHAAFRAHVLNPVFSCVAAKSAFNRDNYRMGVYGELGSAGATAGLAHDLWRFVQDQNPHDNDFTTFVASFAGPDIPDELAFERLLWHQLQQLHDLDRVQHDWDPKVSSNSADATFAWSFAERGFFVVGMHPASSRLARRFAWPTLIFNAHFQFDRLRERKQFVRMRDTIRSRELGLQGSLNPNLSDFGEHSDARQYSGRPVEQDWGCPFHVRTEGE